MSARYQCLAQGLPSDGSGRCPQCYQVERDAQVAADKAAQGMCPTHRVPLIEEPNEFGSVWRYCLTCVEEQGTPK